MGRAVAVGMLGLVFKNPGRWETDCGRYENQNYPVGNAIDPQLWKKITDDELGALARGE